LIRFDFCNALKRRFLDEGLERAPKMRANVFKAFVLREREANMF
jgi:hypothetical protein